MGDLSPSRKKRSRREILSMLMLPRSSVELRKLDRNPTPSNAATSSPFTSKNLKLPSESVTRRTSGVKEEEVGSAVAPASGGTPCLTAVSTAGPDGILAGGGRVVVALAETVSVCKVGNRHLPSLFWAQTTLGFTSDTSLITISPEKREASR